MYKERKIDVALREWSQRSAHKTLLLRGARQVGKYDATLGGITAISQKHRFGGAFFYALLLKNHYSSCIYAIKAVPLQRIYFTIRTFEIKQSLIFNI